MLWLLAGGACPAVTLAQESAAPPLATGTAETNLAALPLPPTGLKGTLFLCGGGPLPDELRQAFAACVGAEGSLVVIPTASDSDDPDVLAEGEQIAASWRARDLPNVTVLHTRSREVADSEAFCAPLRTATGVWFSGGRQSLIAAAYSGTRLERELVALLERGGVVGGTSAGAACIANPMIVRGELHSTPGLGLLPGCLIDQHFLARDRSERLWRALETLPGKVGLGIDEGTALIVRGRELKCLGQSTVTICVLGAGAEPRCTRVLEPGQSSDLLMFLREARAQTATPFPPAQVAPPVLSSGSLVIVGGGGMPQAVVERFLELAGGKEAPIVVLPTANPDPDPNEARFLQRAGATDVTPVVARGPDEWRNPSVIESLKRARGVWFGGGRQWRFVDAYEGTGAEELFHEVLRRGGVIGGSSAGATIQGEFLVRGSPLGNTEMMALGYRRGFAFLPGSAIDQHFSQRKRFADLAAVIGKHPQLLGLGIDEATAVVVQGQTAEVLGKHRVHFYTGEDVANPRIVWTGGRFDLKDRKVLDPGTEPQPDPPAPEPAAGEQGKSDKPAT
ncbi:MAG: cyanophycinase [Planctomycetaceae bacterium]